MDNGMEGMLDTYLFETNSLLDRLDEMLVADEKIGDFSLDDVNEIFRIMHTIKGSSAMMEFGSLAEINVGIAEEFGFMTQVMTEKAFNDKIKKVGGCINRIRILSA